MDEPMIYVLSIEDNAADAMLIQDKLAEAQRVGWDLPRFRVEHVARLQVALERLVDGDRFDVVLSDLDLPDSRADETIATLREHIPRMPIVVLTGREDESLARESVRAGVQDYIYKDEATGSLLARTMMYAIERQENKRALQDARDALERRVDERTAELRQLNEELRSEISERERAERALERKLDQVMALTQASRAVTGSLEIDQVLHTIIALADDVLDSDYTGVVLVDEAGDIGQVLEDLSDVPSLKYRIRDEGFTHWIVRTHRPIIVDEIDEQGVVDLELGEGAPTLVNPYLIESEIQSLAGLPLKVKDRLLGVLYLHSKQPRAFHGQESILQGFANQVAIAIENARLFGEAQREIAERKRMEAALRESETRVRQKLESVLSPEGDLSGLELPDIIDVEAIQELMDDFYALTNIGIAIVDLKGEVLVATGWQDICTQFHRVHPETRQHCIESDTVLSSGVEPGTYRLYKCKNSMWDMATPIVVGDRHVGNVFLGQFFFADEEIDRDAFREQARTYGFDEEAYMAALDRVPRWSREKVDTVFRFYTEFATMISQLSHSNLKLAQALTEKDRLLEARKRSERKFKSYIEHAPYGVFVADEEGRYVEVNEAACRMTGYDRDELLTMRVMQLAPPEQRDLVAEHLQDAVEHSVAVSEKPFVTKDGRTRWWSVTTVRLSDDRLLGYKEDITERKQAEEARRLNRYRLKALLDLGQMKEVSLEDIADFVLDKAVYLTKSEIGFLGFMSEDEAEMIIHAWSEAAMDGCAIDDRPRHFPIDRAGVWAEPIRQRRPLMLNDYASSHPGTKGYPDGHVSLTRLLSVPVFGDGVIEAIVAVANKEAPYDETDLRQVRLLAEGMLRLIHEQRAEEALRESEERYRSLYKSIRDAILVTNTDREIVSCNPAFTDLFGYTLDEIKGRKTCCLYASEEACRQTGEALEEHWGDPNFFQTVNYRKKSGEIFPGETNLFYLRDDAGETQGVIGLVRDVTERRQAEARIARYATELARSNQELQQFAYAVSHDLQEPLRVSTSYLRLLEERYEDELDDRATKYIDSAVGSARRMKVMIQALLRLSRVGTRGEAFAPTDCEDVLEGVLDDLSLKIEQTDAAVTHDPLPTVMADQAQLAQVFQNLVTNAIKFRRESVSPRVHVSAEQRGDEWVFSVADNGIGVDPEQTDRIFEVFQRLHTEEEYPGLGMGLALCTRILKRHGGRIWVSSAPGEGSTFYFALPAA